MRIGFFGTPEIAAFCLARLMERHEVAFVVTGCDKPRGRCLQVSGCPVKCAALEREVPVLEPEHLRDPALPDELARFGAELFVVVAYGAIIPRAIFDLPRHRTINLHPSLLPRYRGAAPMQWALINGETETGITVQLINERLDAGDIILQERFAIDETMTAGELAEIVFPRGAALLDEAIARIGAGTAAPVVQDESAATYCKKIDKDLPRIVWTGGARDIHNMVRGLNPAPVAWTTFRGRVLKIWRTMPFEAADAPALDPGEVAVYKKKRLLAGTGAGRLEIVSVQPETKKVMDAASFINGHRLQAGERLGV